MDNYSSTLLSRPGFGWHMDWFNGGLGNLRLDVVGFLAILGEEAVRKTSRLASLSVLFYLPRLLPAPHSLLFTERPEQYESTRAKVTSVYSGNQKDYLTHITATMFGFPMQPFEVRCLRIDLRNQDQDPEIQGEIKAASMGPVILANVFGCILSLTLLLLSLLFGDGMSLIATVLLSLLSTLVGITNRWSFRLPPRPRRAPSAGDVVIRWPNGSFLVLRCDDHVARELFFAPDTVNYSMRNPRLFIPMSMIGTIALMLSVIALANAKIELQIAWAGAYILINTAHWTAAALPRRLNFDFLGYEIEEEDISTGSFSSHFTESIWKAIMLTKSTHWIRNSEAIPDTTVWMQWLMEAEEAMKHVATQYVANHPHSGETAIGRRKTWQTRVWRSHRVVHEDPQTWHPGAAWSRLYRSNLNEGLVA